MGRRHIQWPLAGLMAATLVVGTAFWVSANHPVVVEGNCQTSSGADVTIVPPGTCGDYDGDGLIGTAEDADGNDGVFGTIAAAIAAANGGANQNGRVVIVASGRFRETVMITAANGNVTLEAAPGVEANIDAVRGGDTAGNTARQGQNGIIVDAPANRYVTIRNVVVRNWLEGIQVLGSSRVTIDHCRVENNRDYGIHVLDTAKVAITHCQVNASGLRSGAAVDNTPNPGIGIEYEDASSGSVAFTTVTGSFADDISKGPGTKVKLFHVTTFDNNND